MRVVLMVIIGLMMGLGLTACKPRIVASVTDSPQTPTTKLKLTFAPVPGSNINEIAPGTADLKVAICTLKAEAGAVILSTFVVEDRLDDKGRSDDWRELSLLDSQTGIKISQGLPECVMRGDSNRYTLRLADPLTISVGETRAFWLVGDISWDAQGGARHSLMISGMTAEDAVSGSVVPVETNGPSLSVTILCQPESNS